MTSIKTTPIVSTFHSNQINAGNEIIKQFEKFDYVHLQAQMQSGKTGSSLFTAFQMIQQNKIDTFHVLSSISDTDLKNQWIEKIDTHYDDYFKPNPSNNTEFQYHTLLKQLLKLNVKKLLKRN